MASIEPPAKKTPTSYDMCLLCQADTSERLVDTMHLNFQTASYKTFLDCVHIRASYNNLKFVKASQRLKGISADELKEKDATWHNSCYKTVTNSSHIKRDKDAHLRAYTLKDSSVVISRKRGRPSSPFVEVADYCAKPKKVTRSQCSNYVATKCFFCQSEQYETLHACSTGAEGRGGKITEVVNKSKNAVWKIRLGNVLTKGDLLSRDILYHSSCFTKQWEQYVQRAKRVERSISQQEKLPLVDLGQNEVELIAADVEFYCTLQERIDSNEYIPISEVESLYRDILCEHNISDVQILRTNMKAKIKQSLKNAVFTNSKGSKPSVLHSKDSGIAAINTAATMQHNINCDMKVILQCCKILREAVKRARNEKPWTFNGSLGDSSNAGIPPELLIMIRWILQGTVSTRSESRKQDIQRSCVVISQHMLQEYKSDRQIAFMPQSGSSFRHTHETPLAVGLSLYSQHCHRSKKDVTLLHATGIGIRYSRVKELTNTIANTVRDNMVHFDGVYVPPGLLKNVPIRCSADNIDSKVDTPDGRNSFHGTSVAVFQRVHSGDSNHFVSDPINLNDSVTTSLNDVPATITEMSPCTISGAPKPKASPHYVQFKLGQHQEAVALAQRHDLCWLMTRHHQRHCVDGQTSSSGLTNNQTTVTTEPSQFNADVQTPRLSTLSACNSIVDASEDTTEPSQSNAYVQTPQLPTWSAYNSIVDTSDDTQKSELDRDHSLPIINAPAHEWTTLVTVLERLYQLNQLTCPNNPSKVIVTFDMDLYKRALKLEYLSDQYKDKWVLCPGAFHIVLCALRCLGKTIEQSGIDEAWSMTLYSSVTVGQIINGNHHNRAIEAHTVTLQVLFDLYFDEFLKTKPAIRDALQSCVENLVAANQASQGIADAHKELMILIEQLNLEKQLAEFDMNHDKYPMFQWARMYMRQVMVLLNFARSNKKPDFLLFLSALEKLCTYFFSYNRLDYAQNIIEFIARMYDSKENDSEIWNRFMAGEFALKRKSVPFTGTGVDQGHEFLNKVLKGEGGIRGITNKPATLLKYCLNAPVLSQLARETEHMLGVQNTSQSQHHRLSPSITARQESAILELKGVLEQCNPFADKTGTLYNLVTKAVMPQNIQNDILNMEKRGQQALGTFVEERICGESNLWYKMPKLRYSNWEDASKTMKLKGKLESVQLKATNSLLARMLIIAESDRQIDIEEVISTYEFTAINSTLMNADGSLIPCTNKSELIHGLEDLVQHNDQSDSIECPCTTDDTYLIIDGMAVVHEIMSVRQFKTCKSLGEAFASFIDRKCQSYAGGRVVFDNYAKEICIKDDIRSRVTGRQSTTKGYHVVDTTPISDTKRFLASKETKDLLTHFLAEKINKLCQMPIITATRLQVQSNTANLPTTGVSTHEEADTLMILHANEICKAKPGNTVHILTQDTDVMVLALRRLPELGPGTAMLMGTGERKRKIMLQPIYDILGPERASALPGFHCLTGCDTTGHIRGKGKKTSLKLFQKADSSMISALEQLGKEEIPSSDVVLGCEKFLCRLMSTKDVSVPTPGKLRWRKFRKLPANQGIDKLPPTTGAWHQHILRGHLQALIWAQDLVLVPFIPDPEKFGWDRETDGTLVPILSNVHPVPEAVVELIKCGCGVSKCSGRCTCKQHHLPCTDLCKCEADEECCNTLSVESIDADEDSDDN